MSISILELTSLQQAWLREIDIAPAFLRSYVTAPESIKTQSDSAALKPNLELKDGNQVKTSATMPAEARAALHQQLGLSKTEEKAEQVVESIKMDLPVLSQQSLKQLYQHAQQCTACGLHEQRQRAVVGAGEENQPDWMVISIAPSSNEEIAGLPMQGKSGELFANQLRSITLPETVTFYTTQLLKCRSPQHPKTEYIQACQRILWRQIELIRPQRLLLLGQATAQLFFGASAAFEQLRGQVHVWQAPFGGEIPALVSYDPVSLLLRPQDKVKAWADLLLLQSLS